MSGARGSEFVVERDASAVGALRALVCQLKAHQATVAPELGPVRDDEECWAITRAKYERQLAQHDGALFVARSLDRRLIGFAFVAGARELGDWAIEAVTIEDIVVEPPWRGRGVGQALLAAAREHAGGRELHLSVLEANLDARRFYGREGFVPFLRVLALRPAPAPQTRPRKPGAVRTSGLGDDRLPGRDS